MNPVSFGLLCNSPLVVLLLVRYVHLHGRMEALARRAFCLRSAVFLALSSAVTTALYACRGSLPLPLLWILLLTVSAAALLLGLLKRVAR